MTLSTSRESVIIRVTVVVNPKIYRSYTSVDNRQVIDNLHWLAAHEDAQKITIRLPLIPDYNTEADIAKSREQLEAMGFTNFDCFNYKVQP